MFLEVITRTVLGRERLLVRNQQSVRACNHALIWQRVMVDMDGRGVAQANVRLRSHTPASDALYVWVLDDDDVVVCPNFVDRLAQVAVASMPDVIFMRMDHGQPLGVLPANGVWGDVDALGEGRIGVSGIVVSRPVWMAHREAWGERYAGDWDFIANVIAGDHRVHWLDVVASACPEGRRLGMQSCA